VNVPRSTALLLLASGALVLLLVDRFAVAGAGSIFPDTGLATLKAASLAQATPTPQTTFKASTAPRLTVTPPADSAEEGSQGWRASGGDERSELSVEATGMPSVCYSLRATNASGAEETVFFSADLSMASLGSNAARMMLNVSLEDTNADGVASLREQVLGSGLQVAYTHQWRVVPTIVQDTRFGGRGLGTPIASPGDYTFELGVGSPLPGPVMPQADTLTLVLNTVLSPGDTVRMQGLAALDDGSGQHICAIPTLS
jgi:hypothetical protein